MEAVEAVNGTLAQMRAEFQERMARFEAGHSSTPSKLASGGTSALAQDYWAFKRFTLDALECLQRQMEFFARDMDALEMRGRRKMLLIHGVPPMSVVVTGWAASPASQVPDPYWLRCRMWIPETRSGTARPN